MQAKPNRMVSVDITTDQQYRRRRPVQLYSKSSGHWGEARPTSLRHIWQSAEPRKSTLRSSSVSGTRTASIDRVRRLTFERDAVVLALVAAVTFAEGNCSTLRCFVTELQDLGQKP